MTQATHPAPGLTHVCDLHVELDPIREMGQGRAGHRRIIPIIGGRVEGPKLNGKLLNLGADWQTIWPSGVAELDTRYAMETHDGAVIEIINYGYRHGPEEVLKRIMAGEVVPADQYYMRTQARLETGDPRYDWVNRTLFIGTGSRQQLGVTVSLYTVD
ncbi:DUF3237 domain-containing protein [Pseudooceanicola sp. MF1-13]|uniref:DUF3237 domain-containing protein n=1 Tax=Pseudooceanicola sp. MF1-13 TaxID=3379095 RepID=UPI003891EF7D